MRKAGETMTQAVPKATGMGAGPPISSWVPFSHRAFALLWTATLISNVGTWMHDVGAGWLMTTISPSPAIVALVQGATTLPFFLFAERKSVVQGKRVSVRVDIGGRRNHKKKRRRQQQE